MIQEKYELIDDKWIIVEETTLEQVHDRAITSRNAYRAQNKMAETGGKIMVTREWKIKHIMGVAYTHAEKSRIQHNLCFTHNNQTFICRVWPDSFKYRDTYYIAWSAWVSPSEEESERIIFWAECFKSGGGECEVTHSKYGSMTKYLSTSSVFGPDELVDYYL